MYNNNKTKVVIACQVMKPELEALLYDETKVEIRYLDQGLHRTPQKMAPLIQEEIDKVSHEIGEVVLGYGLCSNGIAGVRAGPQGLTIPRCHDCIAFFLGSIKAYEDAFAARPGTLYLTTGWLGVKKDPLSIVEEEYSPRFGRETALWVMDEELKHYTHIALIDTGAIDIAPFRERVKENAYVLKKKYEEVTGSLRFFETLIQGPYEQGNFLSLSPREVVDQEMFLDLD